jgi:transcriptional regulator with XRE-family HTH domain
MHHFGSEVRHARIKAGMTQTELGKLTGYDGSEVSRFEAGLREPDARFAEGCDRAFLFMNGWFTRFIMDSHSWDGPYKPWFRPWVNTERKALAIRWWEPMLVPGLIQTEAYMRSVLGWGPDNGNDIESDVTARLERQRIFERDTPPETWFLLSDSVLGYCAGSPTVMREQMLHLVAMAQRPRVTIQVVPREAGAHGGQSGAFAVATMESDTVGVAYLETGVQGMTVREPELVSRAASMFDHLRAEAYPRSKTLEIFRQEGEKWEQQIV